MKKVSLFLTINLFVLHIAHAQSVLMPLNPDDSTKIVKGLVNSFCDKLGESIKADKVTLPYLNQTGVNSLLMESNLDALEKLSGTNSAMSFAYIEKGFRIALRASIDNCPLVDTFLNYDGRQRPAFAHLSKAICQCMGEKKSNFKDPELAQYKIRYIRDSCFMDVFRDPEQLKIVHAANDFQTKAEIDAFDKNFQGYFFKTCSECFEAVMYGYKTMFAEMEKRQQAAKPFAYRSDNNGFDARQNESMMHILHLITPTLGLYSDSKTADLFASAATYRTGIEVINTTKLRFKNNLVVDYMPNTTNRSDGITEYRFTMYQYAAKTKKRTIVCQLIFEFEGKSELIGAFRYIDRSQIANLQTLQNQLDAR